MKKIILAGGGTGGHIYPAITIARAINSLYPDYTVEFVGTPDGLESKIVPKHGFQISFISVGKLNYKGQWFSKIKTLFQIPWAIVKSMALVVEKKPVLVLGVGGYASGPFVLASALLGVPTALWEPNAQPGLTNRLLARFVRKTFVVFKNSLQLMKSKSSEVVGLPIRDEIERLSLQETKSDAANRPFRVLIFGGSQGARAINNCVSEMILGNEWSNVEFVHQTGPLDFPAISQKYQGNKSVKCLDYLYDIENYYSWCDLVICRAGASTLAELAAARKPSILIPLPSAADDHQKKNALSLVDSHAAKMIEQKLLTKELLKREILELISSPDECSKMRDAIFKFHNPNSAQSIAQKLINLQFDSGD